MADVDFENVICHGLGGIGRRTYDYDDEALINTFQPEQRQKIEELKKNKHTSRFLLGIYRLNQILNYKAIYTMKDIKEKELPIFNKGEKIGDYNSADTISFAIKGKNFERQLGTSISCESGYDYFIADNISIMLANDVKFANLPRSANNEGIEPDEVRIAGTIEKPNIISVGVPLINNLLWRKRRGERIDKVHSYKEMITCIRELLNEYGYSNVSIVDSLKGYDLEDKDILAIIDKELQKSEYETFWSWIDEFGDSDNYIEGDICEAYRKFCDASPNHGFQVKEDGQITVLDYPHAISWWDSKIASYIKEFIEQNRMNAIMVNATIGNNPFMVLKSMTEEEILSARGTILEEKRNEKIKKEEERENN